MKIVLGDLWEYQLDHPNRWVCITTNGSITKRNENVMGSGCARELKEKYPEMPRRLAQRLTLYGNQLHMFLPERIVTFPTKQEWNKNSDLDLIRKSSEELAIQATLGLGDLFILPRPGIGAGKLSWQDVFPVIDPILPDNVHVISWL